MSWLTRLFGRISNDEPSNTKPFEEDCPSINPATGLPMLNCAVDIEGNPYGTDLSSDDDWLNDSFSHDDSWSSNNWDD